MGVSKKFCTIDWVSTGAAALLLVEARDASGAVVMASTALTGLTGPSAEPAGEAVDSPYHYYFWLPVDSTWETPLDVAVGDGVSPPASFSWSPEITGGGSLVGPGAIPLDLTIESGGTPLAGVGCWIATDSAGVNATAGTIYTGSNGKPVSTFLLDAGTCYLFRSLAGYTFPQAIELTISVGMAAIVLDDASPVSGAQPCAGLQWTLPGNGGPAPQIPIVREDEVNNGAVSFVNLLSALEVLASVSVDEVATNDLTIDYERVSAAAFAINGRTVAAGKAAQFRVGGQNAGTTYTLALTVTTNSNPAQTKTGTITFTTADA